MEQIGTNAGLVWQALSESGKWMDVKELKRASGIRTERDVYLAIGWLAKEGKLLFEGEGKEATFKLA